MLKRITCFLAVFMLLFTSLCVPVIAATTNASLNKITVVSGGSVDVYVPSNTGVVYVIQCSDDSYKIIYLSSDVSVTLSQYEGSGILSMKYTSNYRYYYSPKYSSLEDVKTVLFGGVSSVAVEYGNASSSHSYTFSCYAKELIAYSSSYSVADDNAVICSNAVNMADFKNGNYSSGGSGSDTGEGSGGSSFDDETWLGRFGSWFSGLGDKIGGFFSNLSDKMSGWFSDLGEKFSAIGDEIKGFFGSFFETLGETLKSLIIPDGDEVKERIDAFREDLPFIGSILDFGSDLGALFGASTYSDNSLIPNISMDLSAAESKYNYGDSAIALDFRWYARYKPYVDMFISAFLLMSYFWLLYKRLPDIIGGIGMITEGNSYYNNLKENSEMSSGGFSSKEEMKQQKQRSSEMAEMHREGWF